MTRFACLFVLVSPAFGAADDMKAMAGFWKPVSVVYNGEERFPDGKKRDAITLVVKDNEYRLYIVLNAAKDEHQRLVTAHLKLDPATKGIEMTIKDGANKGQKCHGIYELKDGNLRVCYSPVEKPKPTKFEAPEGSFCFCEMWTPEK